MMRFEPTLIVTRLVVERNGRTAYDERFHEGVNVTLGLPFPRTSPDHGTAFAIASKGIARPDSMIAAIRLAVELAESNSSSRK